MRISRVQLVGLAVALAGGAAQQAAADDLTVTTALTDPIATSTASGGTPGDITVNTGGSVTVDANETAITMDSDNDVSNGGLLRSTAADHTRGIVISGARVGTITNSNSIQLTEDDPLEDTDSDGDLDGAFASGTDRHAILLDGGSLTGDIINSGAIIVYGNNSSGIWLNGLLDGTINHTGAITVRGDNSYGVLVDGPVTGDLLLRGGVSVTGENSQGLVVNDTVDGQVRISGGWSVTGYHSVTPPSDTSDLDADDLLQSGSAVGIFASVGGGVTIDGVGVEDDLDDDDDSVDEPTDTNDDAAATVFAITSAPAVLVQADGFAMTLGANPYGYGFHNRGGVTGNGAYEGFSGTALRIEGINGGTVSTAGGIVNDGSLTGLAVEADATGIYIGSGVTATTFLNRRAITASAVSDAATTTTAILIDAGANVPSFDNSGTIIAALGGETGDAVIVRDLSNTLATVTNSGSMTTVLVATDDDLTDDIVPVVNGDAIAIDVSASTINFTYNQIADTPFTDDDGVDDDADARPAVELRGDVLLGSGDDTVNLLAGTMTGDIFFNTGADTFLVDNGATFTGSLDDSGGDLDITLNNGAINVQGGAVNITSAAFGDGVGSDSTLGIVLSTVPAETTLITASGTVTFGADTHIALTVPTGLPVADTLTFLTANGGLFGASNVTGPVTGEGVPYLYNLSISVTDALAADGDPNSLQATYERKSAVELGLTDRQTAAFDPILEVLTGNSAAAAAIVSLDNEDDFFDAYQDLMPAYSSAATELATTAIQQAQSATSNRMAATRLHGLDNVSVWAQEIGYGLNRESPELHGLDFRGTGFGLATGIDGPLDNGGLFGLSISFITSEVEEPGRPDGEVAASFGQGNAYLGLGMGPIDLDFIGGLGIGQMQSRRFVEIGDDYATMAEADWWAYEGHGAVRASAPMAVSNSFFITPQAALTYVYLAEEGYEEEGSSGFDLEADSTNSQRLWGDVGVELSARFRRGANLVIAPRLYAGYRANLLDDDGDRTYRFAEGTSAFTLANEDYGDGGALVGIGFDADNGYSTVSIGYEGEFGDQIDRHSLNMSLRFRF